MRGSQDRQLAMLMSLSPEDLIPADHPIRRIAKIVDAVLADLDDDFAGMYAAGGRPSVPPEQLLKATVLMAMYSIRSERAFCERLNYDLLFKWFLDLPIDARALDATTFTKNRQRLLKAEIADWFFAAVVARPACAVTCRRSISRWTGPCWRRGLHTRASNPKTATARTVRRRRGAGTRRSISGVRNGRTRRMSRPPILTPAWPAKAGGPQRGCVSAGICSWRTATP